MGKDQDLTDRVRAAMPTDRAIREVSLFGGLSFTVDGAMVVAVRRDGDLLVRIDPARRGQLLTVPGAEPAAMGPDRPLGPYWITVRPNGVAAAEQLAFRIGCGLDHGGTHAQDSR